MKKRLKINKFVYAIGKWTWLVSHIKNRKRFFILSLIAAVSFLFGNNLIDSEIITEKFCNEISSIEFAKKHTVHIKTEYGTGSGFFITDDLIVTNNHVVEDTKNVQIGMPDGLLVSGEVIGWNNKTDIAIIKSSLKTDKPFQWRKNKIMSGESLIAVGFPLSSSSSFKGDSSITKGVMSALRNGLYDTKYIQTDTVINPGNSGGPIVDKCARVVAVSDLSVKIDARSETVFYGIFHQDAKLAVDNIIKQPSYTKPDGTLPRFEDGISPENVVKDYYELINSSETLNAYQYSFTRNRQKALDPKKWLLAFSNVKNIKVEGLEKFGDDPIKVKAKLKVQRVDGINYLEDETESIWTLKYNAGNLLLDDLDTKTLSTKAIYSEDYVTDFKSNRLDYENIYSRILARNMSKYPEDLVNRIKSLVSTNKAILNRVYSKLTSSTPLTEEDIKDLTNFDINYNEITTIQKQFDQIDWDQYVRSFY